MTGCTSATVTPASHRLNHCSRFGQDGHALPLNLETAVGRARVGGDAVRWQGATMLRAPARKEEQRRQRDAALLNRVCSGVTREVTAGVGRKVCVHAVCPADASGQLRFLGSRDAATVRVAEPVLNFVCEA